MKVEKLEWDSVFFGLRIGRVDIKALKDCLQLEINKEQLRQKYDLIYVFSDYRVDLTNYTDLFFADQKATYVQMLAGKYQKDGRICLYSKNCPNDKLYELALESGGYSRFLIDPNFPTGSFERLYRKWIEKAVDNKDTTVLCYYDEDELAGMLTIQYNINSLEAQIGLMAVNPRFRGRGIGSSLIREACSFLVLKGIKIFRTITQYQNLPACRLYENSGFRLESIRYVYHWWLKDSYYDNSVQ